MNGGPFDDATNVQRKMAVPRKGLRIHGRLAAADAVLARVDDAVDACEIDRGSAMFVSAGDAHGDAFAFGDSGRGYAAVSWAPVSVAGKHAADMDVHLSTAKNGHFGNVD